MSDTRQSLYDLTQEAFAIREVSSEFEDADAPTDEEAEAALLAWMQEHDADLADKIDAYRSVLSDLDDKVGTLKAEEARLKERRQMFEARADRMKRAIKTYMETAGHQKIETAFTTVSIRKTGGRLPVILATAWEGNEERLPPVFRKATYRADLSALHEALTNPESELHELAGDYADLGERGTYVHIK